MLAQQWQHSTYPPALGSRMHVLAVDLHVSCLPRGGDWPHLLRSSYENQVPRRRKLDRPVCTALRGTNRPLWKHSHSVELRGSTRTP